MHGRFQERTRSDLPGRCELARLPSRSRAVALRDPPTTKKRGGILPRRQGALIEEIRSARAGGPPSRTAPAKAILDEKQAAVDELQPGYDAALAAYEQAKSNRIAAEQKLSDEIARQEAEEAAKQQAAYPPKHLAGTDTAQPGSLAQTGDRAGLIGETFAIGGTALVAAGVFLDQKKRREQM